MKDSLRKICEDFIANRDVMREAFKWDSSYLYPVCGNIFCARGQMADLERLKQCKKVIDSQAGVFSNFRGYVRPALATMLAMNDDPENRMWQAIYNYDVLKKEFWGSSYLALVAYLLTELADKDQVEEKAVRGKDIYNRMKKEHPFLTGNEDSVFAVLMAFSSRPDDELITDMEACYQALRARFSAGDALQTVSHVLSLADGNPVLKASRVIDLYNSLRDAGIKYGRSHELSVLAALSLTDAGIPELVEDIREVDAFLKTQKGFGTFGTGSQLRAMNAALVVSDQYTVRDRANTAAMTSTLAIIIAQQMAMCAVMASTAAATAASSN